MIEVELSGNPKIARFTDAEFACLVKGVWPLAAKSPVRGRLLVHDQEATPEDVAHQARCSPRVALRTMQKMWQLGMLERDEDMDCVRVHDWEKINPAPKVDRTAAERQAKRRQRLATTRDVTPVSRRDSNGSHAVTVTGVTPPEVEVEVNSSNVGSTSERLRASANVEPEVKGVVG